MRRARYIADLRPLLAAAMSCFTAACVIDRATTDTASVVPRTGAFRGHFGGIQIELDRDPGERPPPDLELATGYGAGIEAHIDGIDTEVSYFHSEHRELRDGASAEVHQPTVFGWFAITEPSDATVRVVPRLGAGLGGLVIDFSPDGPHDIVAPLAAFGFELELLLGGHVGLHVGGRVGFAGLPGDTEAVSSIVTIGGSLRF